MLIFVFYLNSDRTQSWALNDSGQSPAGGPERNSAQRALAPSPEVSVMLQRLQVIADETLLYVAS